MFSEISEMYVDIAVTAEYNAAIHQHGEYFDNPDEAFDVLKEEIEEAMTEMLEIKKYSDTAINRTDKIKQAARNGIKELAQVLAVIQKMDKGYGQITEDEIEYYR